MAKRNDAFEKAAKAMEKRLERAAKEQEKALEKAGKKIASSIERQLEVALKAAIRNVQSIADEFRLNAEQTSRLRQGLETTEGAAGGVKSAAQWAALTPDPRLKAAILVLGALVGAAAGAAQEEIRLQVQQANREIERERLDIRHLLASVERDVERTRAMRRRTGRLG